MLILKRHRDVAMDQRGNVRAGWTVTVQSYSGAAVTIYSDRLGANPIPSTLTTDALGGYGFFAVDGLYRLIFTKGADSYTVDDVPIGTGGNTTSGILHLEDYLNASGSNAPDAFTKAFDLAAERKASTRWGRVLIECEGARLGIPSTLLLPSSLGDCTLQNIGMLYPTGEVADWLEDEDPETGDALAVAFFNKYQKVSLQGKTWSLRKPLMRVEAGAGFAMVNCFRDGKGNALVRLAAGVRVPGNISDRVIEGGKTTNVESYGAFVGHDTQNSGQIDIERHEFKPNSRTSRADRTSYGVASGGNDMQWLKMTISNCHSPLLFGEYGSTTNLLGCDLFNGANFDTEGYYHRLAETHGNSCTFVGGRSGNGVWMVYNPNFHFGPTKFGVTEGSGETTPPAAFVFVATEPNTEVNGFTQLLSETPIDLVTDIPWYKFETEGLGTWAMGTAQLESLKGHITASAKGKNFDVQMAPNEVIKTFVGPMTRAVIAIRDDATDKVGGIGVAGNRTQVWTGDAPTWEWPNNKNFRPVGDNEAELGSSSNRIKRAHINAFRVLNSAPVLDENSDMGFQRISNTVVRLHFRGSDGVVRTADLPTLA